MSSIISAIGTSVAEYRFAQNEVFSFMVEAHQLNPIQAARLKKLYDASGIEYRHSVIPDFGSERGQFKFFGNEAGLSPFPTTHQRGLVYEEQAWQIGKKAVGEIWEKTAVKPEDITHLITVSCTGMYAPGLDIDLVDKLGLKHSTERTCINFMGCYGAFNALKTADYICRSQHNAKVLIVDVELCTLHLQIESTLDNWVANSLFSDGAAAVLVEPEDNRSTKKGFKMKSFYNVLIPEAKTEMGWRIGNTGFEMRLTSQVAKNIHAKIGWVYNALLKKADMPHTSISRFAIHPGGRRILEACEETLELPEESLQFSYGVLQKFGNMSSATILFVLKGLLEAIEPQEQVAGFAFGPGLTVESMVLETI